MSAHTASACPGCGQGLETPLVCTGCGELQAVEPLPGPFETLGLARAFAVDEKALKKRLLKLSRHVHPDFFGTADTATKQLAERNSAHLNDSFEVLGDAFRRADWLVAALGGPSEADERQMPQEFLMEVLEWNEVLEAAREAGPGTPAWEALDPLEAELSEQRSGALARVASGLDPLPAEGASTLGSTRRELNAIRYLDRSLGQIRTMRLAR